MKILFGVFDWGLGHATRDIPLIEELVKDNKVDILSTGNALAILKNRFKEKCNYYDVPSISLPYTKTSLFLIKFIFTSPLMLADLKVARAFTENIISKKKYDLVMSDCRYDVYDRPENSFLINHQLKFKAPALELVGKKYLGKIMKKYNTVIVPDFPDRTLAGELSLNEYFEGNVEYIGVLSHVRKKKVKKDINYLFSLSGPEPQRTVLQTILLEQINRLNGKIIVAGANPLYPRRNLVSKKYIFYPFLDSKQQEDVMNRAKTIITRSGYTTMMELAELEKNKALLIPTPGQTEQEYLADYYEEKKIFHHCHQRGFNITEIEQGDKFKGFKVKWKTKTSIKKIKKIIGL